MRVTVEKKPQSAVTLDIQAEPEEFGEAMEQAFRRISRRVQIPGFRPGRAPRFIIEQRIGRDAIVEEAQRQIMDDLYRQALDQEEIVPVSEPVVDIYQAEPVGFKVDVEVYPKVDLGDYTAVRVEPREVNVTDEDVDRSLKDLQRANSLWVTPETPRSPLEGDQVSLDLTVTQDGEPFQEPLKEGVFVLGESNLFPQIEEALKQLKPGESAEFDITFAEDDEKVNPDIRDKTLHYQVTLNEVKQRELPEIDDDLAKTVGEFETIDDLRADLRATLLRTRALEARSEVVNEAVRALAENAAVMVPSSMIDRQVDDEVERLRTRLSQQGSSLDEYLRFAGKTLEQFEAEERPEAEERLRNSLVLESFAKAEGIEVSEDDLAAEIDRLTTPSENQEQMREIYSSPYFRGLIGEELASRKITDRLIEVVTEGRGAVTGEGADALTEPEVEAGEPASDEEAQGPAAAASTAEGAPSEPETAESSAAAAALEEGEAGAETREPGEDA